MGCRNFTSKETPYSSGSDTGRKRSGAQGTSEGPTHEGETGLNLSNQDEGQADRRKPPRCPHCRKCFSVLLLVIVLVLTSSVGITGLRRSMKHHCPKIVTSSPCEDGWIWSSYKCYYFSKNISEWQWSQDFCATRNALLAHVESLEELDFITRFKGPPDHWIGLNRINDTEPWRWTNGSLFNNMFKIAGVSTCVFVNTERVSSSNCYGDKKWICTKLERN
ncbi:C-type lectin domain family 2 member D-like isoform X2 [Engystomops pustulosus]|uniref:C-type lectin domain family 2 member D-like isoform X2 n=1 Tax=Engystomops pustulosus TaxID=76066 RepID=UPI003AFAE334